MSAELRVLLAEDMDSDALLVIAELREGGYVPTYERVESASEMEAALSRSTWDLVISDHCMPGFTSTEALALVQASGLDLPFILVSGTMGEDVAVQAMKAGAHDFLLKGNLARLVPAVARELREAEVRRARHRAEQALQESEAQFRGTFNQAAMGMAHASEDGAILLVNPKCCDIFGYTADEMRGRNFNELIYPDDIEATFVQWRRLAAGSVNSLSIEKRFLRKEGTAVWINATVSAVRRNGGQVERHIMVIEDISERKEQQDKISRLSRIHAMLSAINATIVRVRDRQELFCDVCRIVISEGGLKMAWVGLTEAGGTRAKPVAWMGFEEGYLDEVESSLNSVSEDDGIVGRVLRDKTPIVINDLTNDPQVVFKKEALSRGYQSLIVLPLRVGEAIVAVMVLYAAQAHFFDDEELKLLSDLAADISFSLEHIEKAERLNYLAQYDALTGLPNRTLFRDRLGQLVRTAACTHSKVAVLAIDLERFRHINETLGRHAADEVLKLVAQRLQDIAGIARIGSDCFAAAIAGVQEESDLANAVEQQIFEALLRPVTIAGVELRIPVRLGIALFPNDGPDADTLIMNAEAALKKAKNSADKYLFYAPQMNARIAERLSLENQLRRALEEDEFVLYYQPQIDLKSGRMTGLEALIRWRSPALGLVAPGTFVPLLEETGLILDVGRWVIEKAAADYWALLIKGLNPPRIAVNVSAVQLRQKGFVAELTSAIEKGDRGGDLNLEITESLVMEDIDGTIEKLKAIRELGVGVALDDFGTGFSSLSYLVRLPINCLKIDRTFIVDMADNAANMTIVSAVISLAHSLNLKVVAEGVETKEQAKLLRLLKCDEMQGYLFSKPVPLQQIEILLGEANEDRAQELQKSPQ